MTNKCATVSCADIRNICILVKAFVSCVHFVLFIFSVSTCIPIDLCAEGEWREASPVGSCSEGEAFSGSWAGESLSRGNSGKWTWNSGCHRVISACLYSREIAWRSSDEIWLAEQSTASNWSYVSALTVRSVGSSWMLCKAVVIS